MGATNPQRFNMIPRGQPNPEANGLYVRFEDWQAMCDVAKTSLSEQLKLEAEAQAFREEVAAYEDAMRSLACQLGAGGFNAESLTAAQLVAKVQWGINNLTETQGRLLDEVSAERDALRARVVVTPHRQCRHEAFECGGIALEHFSTGRNYCLDELARLNGKAVSEGLLRGLRPFTLEHEGLRGHLDRVFFGKGKEAGEA